MTFRNEVLEGIAAYKAMTPTGQDNYYNEKAKIAKRENDQYEEQDRGDAAARAAAAARKAQANPLIPTASRSDTIGSGPPGVAPTQAPTQTAGDVYQGLARGGRVRRFADGGFAGGLASGIKSTFRMPQRQQTAFRPLPPGRPDPMDAGLPGSGDIAADAATRYGSAPAPPQYRRGGRVRAISTGYRAGGAVTPRSRDRDEEWEREPEFPDDEMFHPPPVRNDSGPHDDNSNVMQEPEDDDYFLRHPQAPQPPPRREVPTMQSGGRVPRYDAGGDIEADEQTWREIEARNAADVARRRAMNPSAAGAAFRGGRPEFDPSQTPEAGRRNEADEVIRSILNADLPHPDTQTANDPSTEINERGERDRALTTLPPPSPDDLPALPQSPAAVRSARRRQGQLPPSGTPPQPPVDQDPSTRQALEETFQSPEPEPDTDDSSLSTDNARIPEGSTRDREFRGNVSDSDAYLSTDNARDPEEQYGPPTEAEYEDPTSHRRRWRPNIGEPQALETSVPPADAKYPTQPPGAFSRKTSPLVSWASGIERTLGTGAGDAAGTTGAVVGDEDRTERGGDERWVMERRREIASLRTGLLEEITPEERERREARISELEADLKRGTPSERVRGRKRAIEAGTPPSEFADGRPDAQGVGPVLDAMRQSPVGRAVHSFNQPPKPPTPVETGSTRPTGATQQPTEQYEPPAPTTEQRAVQTGPRPTVAEVTAGVGEQAAAPAGPAAPPPERPAQLGPEGVAGTTTPPSVAPSVAPPVASRQGPEGGGTTTATTTAPPPKNNGTSTPGGRPGATTTPPAGSAPANRPSTAEKAETRTAQFDPTSDRVDPQTGRTMPRQLDAQGRAIATGPPPPQVAQGDGGPPSGAGSLTSATGYSNQDIATTLNGASTLVRPSANGGPPPPGHLAASRPVFNQFVQAHNENGKLTPGEAIVAGMTGRYMAMLKQGRVQQANMMAYGILQAANLEASAHGAAGRDAIARGEYGVAKQHMVDGLNYIVDGVSQRLSADGQSVESVDPRTGQVTATTPLDGRIVLQTLMGLDNGNMFWKTLQASAQMLQKPDRNAEGRQLTNDLRRRQIAMADYRLAHPPAPRGGGGGGGTSTGMSKVQAEAARIRGERPPQQSVAAAAHPDDNSDLAFINYDVRDPEPEPEPAVAESHRSPSDLDEEDRYA